MKPILDRSSYVKVGLNGIQLLEVPERLEISTAIVGVIFAYITDGMPREATVDWEYQPGVVIEDATEIEVERVISGQTLIQVLHWKLVDGRWTRTELP